MQRSAFTIWELLAVIVIILVVAILLFPVFAARHMKYPKISCGSVEKQLALAILQYTRDNDERFPNIAEAWSSRNTWRSAVFPYANSKGTYQCPSREDKAVSPDGFPRSYAANYTGSYSGRKSDIGDGAFGGPGSRGVKLRDIPSPATLIMLCEVSRHSRHHSNIDNIAAFNPSNRTLWAGHSSGGNYTLADGHVKWLKPEDTKELWHRNPSVPLTPAAIAVLSAAQSRAGE